MAIKEIYTKLDSDRQSILDKCIDCAALTLPSLLTDKEHKEEDNLDTPFQSLGARAVNNLASKLLLALLPPNTPFFKLTPDKLALLEAEEREPGITQKIKNTLNSYEDTIATAVEREGIRIQSYEMFKHLIVAGNTLIYKDNKNGIKVYPLSQYVVQRDGNGKVIRIIILELVTKVSLPESVQSQIDEEDLTVSFELYTNIELNNEGTYDVTQEVNGINIKESESNYKEEELPWLALRWTSITNENYGRGLVEQYLGDLRSLEGLNMAILDAAAASAKVLFFVDPMGTTKAKSVVNANNGDVIQGRANEVSTLQVQKGNDLTIAYNTMNDIQRRLSSAFLMTESARRDSERTTAYEIQIMASELEDALGGIYSILSLEFQQPLLKIMLKEQGIKFDKDLVEPVIVSGLDALSRAHDYNKLTTFTQSLASLQNNTTIEKYANMDVIIERIANSLGIETEGLIKTKEQIAQEQQQEMMQQADNTALQSMANSGGQALIGGVEQALNETPEEE